MVLDVFHLGNEEERTGVWKQEKFGKSTKRLWGRRKRSNVGVGIKWAVILLHVIRIKGIRRKALECKGIGIGRSRANETLSLMCMAGRNPQRTWGGHDKAGAASKGMMLCEGSGAGRGGSTSLGEERCKGRAGPGRGCLFVVLLKSRTEVCGVKKWQVPQMIWVFYPCGCRYFFLVFKATRPEKRRCVKVCSCDLWVQGMGDYF